jgi:hypothetical protein
MPLGILSVENEVSGIRRADELSLSLLFACDADWALFTGPRVVTVVLPSPLIVPSLTASVNNLDPTFLMRHRRLGFVPI